MKKILGLDLNILKNPTEYAGLRNLRLIALL